WKQHGGELKGLTFDLKEGSLSRRVLDAYVQQRFGSGSTAGGTSDLDGGGGKNFGRDLGQYLNKAQHGQKASTATEYLTNNPNLIHELALDENKINKLLVTVDFPIATENPQWMKNSIEELLEETFRQDYWRDINVTPLTDTGAGLTRGL